jgi:hypothetical protein
VATRSPLEPEWALSEETVEFLGSVVANVGRAPLNSKGIHVNSSGLKPGALDNDNLFLETLI